MTSATISIRNATASDQLAITTLVHSERLNPIDLDWRRFIIATDPTGLVGAVQLRMHDYDACELGSLVVRPDARGRGIGARLIDARLTWVASRVLMITGAKFAAHYERWGFRRITLSWAPASVRRNFYFVQILGGMLLLLSGRRPKELAILDRGPSYRVMGSVVA